MSANKPICLFFFLVPIYGLHVHHRCVLCLRSGGTGARKRCFPTRRWGFYPGLITSRAGGGRWPAERSGGLSLSSPLYPTPVTPPPGFADILTCVCTIVRHKKRNLWHNRSFKNKSKAVAVPATAPVLKPGLRLPYGGDG